MTCPKCHRETLETPEVGDLIRFKWCSHHDCDFNEYQVWTTTPPTEPGWYWCQHTGMNDPQLVSVKDRFGDGVLQFALYGITLMVDECNQIEWAGPLVPPE